MTEPERQQRRWRPRPPLASRHSRPPRRSPAPRPVSPCSTRLMDFWTIFWIIVTGAVACPRNARGLRPVSPSTGSPASVISMDAQQARRAALQRARANHLAGDPLPVRSRFVPTGVIPWMPSRRAAPHWQRSILHQSFGCDPLFQFRPYRPFAVLTKVSPCPSWKSATSISRSNTRGRSNIGSASSRSTGCPRKCRSARIAATGRRS